MTEENQNPVQEPEIDYTKCEFRDREKVFFNQTIFEKGQVTGYIPGIENHKGKKGPFFEPVNVVRANAVTVAGGKTVVPDAPLKLVYEDLGHGWYKLSNGQKVQGKAAAEAGQAKLNEAINGKQLPGLNRG